MTRRTRNLLSVTAFAISFLTALVAQETFEPIASFPFSQSSLKITQLAVARRPFTVAGERGVVLGQQDGSFELWALPYKLLQHTHLSVELDGYGVPIELNPLAGAIEVLPDRTTITYTHAAITVRQTMFAVRNAGNDDPATLVLFSIDAVKPGMLRLDFEPVLAPMWPAPQHGSAGASWIKIGSGGAFLLSCDDPRRFAIVAMPGATSEALVPYQERPQKRPLQFNLRFDPKKDAHRFFPLVAMLSDGSTPSDAESQAALVKKVIAAEARIPQLYRQTSSYYAKFFSDRLLIDTPDASLNNALAWSEIAIDQSQVKFHDETGLTAGWYTSADSLRPGYGWFFGRDTLWTLYAVHSYGDFGLARRALEFLLRRQRDDGKIMHEFSQTADIVDWKSFPYWYASADSTPLLVMVMEDYVRSSGDREFLRAHWDSVQKAYRFTRSHDSDGDGIYDNSQGTGWVESWPPGMPNQEIYLAALDQESAEAYSRLANLMGDEADARSAKAVADSIRSKLAAYRGRDGFFAFSRNRDGSFDSTATIFPAVAWWTGRLALTNADAMLSRWGSYEFLTDWGSREVSDRSPLYDPISYHQGSVWPLFTGWTAMAEYRAGKPLAGMTHLLSSARLTFISDLGGVTELLSGDVYAPLGRSSSHQMWSSAMVLTPAVRGMFGVEGDALHHRLRVAPHLPATWDHATLRNVPYAGSLVDIAMNREGASLNVDVTSKTEQVMCLDTRSEFVDVDCKETSSKSHKVRLQLPKVEIGLPAEEPILGERSSGLRILSEKYADSETVLELQAPAGSTVRLPVRLNGLKEPRLRIDGGTLKDNNVVVQFPKGSGYTEQKLTVRW